MSEPKEWIGVDLDGTLAEYHGWVSPTHIGAPVPAMVARVKQWLKEGKEVRVFTNRVSPRLGEEPPRDVADVVVAVQGWCKLHIGESLRVTNTKDHGMIQFWDDRAVQVEVNTGREIGTTSNKDPRSSDPLFPPNLLRAAASLFEERNAEYGDTYRRYGKLLIALFPEGGIPAIETPEDATRFNLIMMCLAKLQRYAHNFKNSGHQDSARDLIVYAAMLEEHTK